MDRVEIETSCPSSETLQQLIEGTISDADSLEDHLQTCSNCQQRLDDLSQSDVLKPFAPSELGTEIHLRFLDEPRRDGDLGSIDHLMIEQEIGRGGAGIVFRARDPDLSRDVAVKVLNNDGSYRSEARFERESKIAARIRSDYVVNVHAIGRTIDGRPYLVMPLISGYSLKEMLAQQPLTEQRSAELVMQIALGLQTLHNEGIVHRDIKPANILIDEFDQRAKLTDFGLARERVGDVTLTQADVLCGTPEYMSPEQSSGQDAAAQSDIYSLGITLYECLTGTTPFRGSPFNILQQHCNVEPVRPSQINPKVSSSIENVCLKSLSKDPQRRYTNSGELAEDLNRFLNGEPVAAKQSTRLEKLLMWARRNRGVAALSAIVTFLLATLAIGSSIAAWNLNLANQRILAEKDKAAEAERRAVQDRTAAVTALNQLVDSLYDDLSRNSATINAREKLVNTALEGLQSVSSAEDSATDRTNYLAHLRIAELASLKGDFETAQEHYQRSVAIARAMVTSDPKDARSRRDLALVLSNFSVFLRSHDFDSAKRYSDQSLTILNELLAENPSDRVARTRRIIEKNLQLELLRIDDVSDTKSVAEYGKSILPDLEQLLAGGSEIDPAARKAAWNAYFVVGRSTLESGDNKAAFDYFQAAREHVQVLLKDAPGDLKIRSGAASIDRAISMAQGARGYVEESLFYYEQAKRAFAALAAENPDDLMFRQQYASSLSLGCPTLLSNGKITEAIAACNEAEQIYEDLIALAPENNFYKMVLIENRTRMLLAMLVDQQWEQAHQLNEATLSSMEDELKLPKMVSLFSIQDAVNQLSTNAWLAYESPARNIVVVCRCNGYIIRHSGFCPG